MTARYLLSPLAQSDIDKIWDYTAGRWGIDQAESYIRQLWKIIETIAMRPTIGIACPEVRPGYYKYASGSHLLFFRVMNDHIDIIRILHQRMDYMEHLY